MRNILAALLTAALCLGLAACGPAPEPEPTPTPTPSVSPSPEAAEFALACYPEAGFHPITGSNRTNLALGGLLYEGLFALNGQFQPQEALCASASVSADGLQWSFIPRSGVTFSDGSPLTAAEIAASLNLTRTSPLYSARFAGVTDIAAANGMVTVTLSRANGALPALLDIPIVKETGGVPLGTGPYVLAGTGENLALEARSDWWQGKALPRDTIPLRAIQEADDLIHAFDTRDIALVSTDLTGTNALGFSGSFAAVDYPTSTMLYVGFNTADGPCRSAQVRQALLRGFDRAAVSTAQFSRHAQPAALPVSPASPLYDEALAQTLDYAPPGHGAAPHRRRLHQSRRGMAEGGAAAGAHLCGPKQQRRPAGRGGDAGRQPDRRRPGGGAAGPGLGRLPSGPDGGGSSTCTWGRCGSPPTLISPPS